ncbi:DUF4190 domain-containing protein [Mycobacterium sp. 852013-51886_SCH5428379]|uniref:DUF4190 domain-containing protein n=1 Tax=Mycobacterium sp. 852013-51886_SCH5428379 TaxID=1834111 RepID=UPI0007FC38BE|nr:DUF4190 domain-containing protein [Mycobacterium sp. 852013-51886_SCH5428379]OBB59323.1 DUF4190 domain-containing protein [Mycobacterium sp. 852013-51886_SCH5428379]
MTEPDKPENTPSSTPPPPPPPPNPGQQQAYPQQQPYQQQPYGYGAAPGGYPPPPPSGYPAGPPGGYGAGPVQQAPKNGVGIAALIVAIIALLSVYGGVVLGIVAVILGVIGRSRAKRGEATNGGIALAGIVLGLLSIIVAIVAIVLTVQFVQEVGGTDLYDCLQQAGSDSEAQQECQDQFQQNIEEQFNISVTPSP